MRIDNDLTNKWLNRLKMTANTHDGKDKLAQIQSVLEFFNKPSPNTGLQVTKNSNEPYRQLNGMTGKEVSTPLMLCLK